MSLNNNELTAAFGEVLSKLDNKFCKSRAIYTMYFKLTMSNGIVLVDSTSKDMIENCFISFTHKMNGSGQANTFTLELLFKPSDRSILTIKNIESALLSNCIIYENAFKNNEQSTEGTTQNTFNNCTFQYGYGDDTALRSPMYNGCIMDYDCKLENGNLRYTITGYDGLYSAKEYRISAKSDYLTSSTGDTIDSPLLYIKRIFEVEFGENKLYDLQFANIDNPSEIKCIDDSYKQFSQKNIFQVISDILSACLTPSQYQAATGSLPNGQAGPSGPSKNFLPYQKQIFGYYIDDTSSTAKYGTIYIYLMESLYGEENKDKTTESLASDVSISFSWFAPTSGSYNHIVKSWNPKYEGSVLFALATNYISNEQTYYTMNDDGEIVSVIGLGAARLGVDNKTRDNSMIFSTIQEYDNWAFVTQYPYNASMTILGCPCEVPMLTKVNVNARMGHELHHSSGLYFILSKTDKINSSGFFTDFEMFKFTPGFNPDYTVIKKDEEDYDSNNYNGDDNSNLSYVIKTEGIDYGDGWYATYGGGNTNPLMYYYIDNNGTVHHKTKDEFENR